MQEIEANNKDSRKLYECLERQINRKQLTANIYKKHWNPAIQQIVPRHRGTEYKQLTNIKEHQEEAEGCK